MPLPSRILLQDCHDCHYRHDFQDWHDCQDSKSLPRLLRMKFWSTDPTWCECDELGLNLLGVETLYFHSQIYLCIQMYLILYSQIYICIKICSTSRLARCTLYAEEADNTLGPRLLSSLNCEESIKVFLCSKQIQDKIWKGGKSNKNEEAWEALAQDC